MLVGIGMVDSKIVELKLSLLINSACCCNTVTAKTVYFLWAHRRKEINIHTIIATKIGR